MSVKNPLVSIIVPVYNAEDFLSDCIDSILYQSYKNIELILIDDGSNDRSGPICDERAMADHRIRAVHQKNAGVSAARNRGIDMAVGDFVTFIDADDTITKESISAMISHTSSGADVVRMNYISVRSGVEKQGSVGTKPGLYKKEKIVELIGKVMYGEILGYTWLLLIDSKLLKRTKARFDTSLAMMEDTKFYVDLFDSCDAIYISDEITYKYRIINESASRGVDNYRRNVANIVKINSYFKEKFTGRITNIDKKLDATHAISMISQVATSLEYPKPRLSVAGKNLHWLHKNESFRRLCQNADLSNASAYSRLTLWLVEKDWSPLLLMVLLTRGIIRKFA